MPRTDRIHLRTPAATIIAAACSAGLAITAGIPACITAPPPEVPTLPAQGPLILQDQVNPPANQDLTELPPDGSFNVPVFLSQPGRFEVRVFIDFYPGLDNTNPVDNPSSSATNATVDASYDVSPATLDGGIYSVTFILGPNQIGDPSACHWIEFLVADSFASVSAHTPVDRADHVVWHYVPDGLNGCLQYDAGPLQDGAFPDSPPDGLLLPPPGVGPD